MGIEFPFSRLLFLFDSRVDLKSIKSQDGLCTFRGKFAQYLNSVPQSQLLLEHDAYSDKCNTQCGRLLVKYSASCTKKQPVSFTVQRLAVM
jgi:hypothetical protein